MLPSKLLIVSHNGSHSFLTFSSRCRPWASVWARDIPTTAVKGTTAGQSGVSPPAHRVPVRSRPSSIPSGCVHWVQLTCPRF